MQSAHVPEAGGDAIQARRITEVSEAPDRAQNASRRQARYLRRWRIAGYSLSAGAMRRCRRVIGQTKFDVIHASAGEPRHRQRQRRTWCASAGGPAFGPASQRRLRAALRSNHRRSMRTSRNRRPQQSKTVPSVVGRPGGLKPSGRQVQFPPPVRWYGWTPRRRNKVQVTAPVSAGNRCCCKDNGYQPAPGSAAAVEKKEALQRPGRAPSSADGSCSAGSTAAFTPGIYPEATGAQLGGEHTRRHLHYVGSQQTLIRPTGAERTSSVLGWFQHPGAGVQNSRACSPEQDRRTPPTAGPQ